MNLLADYLRRSVLEFDELVKRVSAPDGSPEEDSGAAFTRTRLSEEDWERMIEPPPRLDKENRQQQREDFDRLLPNAILGRHQKDRSAVSRYVIYTLGYCYAEFVAGDPGQRLVWSYTMGFALSGLALHLHGEPPSRVVPEGAVDDLKDYLTRLMERQNQEHPTLRFMASPAWRPGEVQQTAFDLAHEQPATRGWRAMFRKTLRDLMPAHWMASEMKTFGDVAGTAKPDVVPLPNCETGFAVRCSFQFRALEQGIRQHPLLARQHPDPRCDVAEPVCDSDEFHAAVRGFLQAFEHFWTLDSSWTREDLMGSLRDVEGNAAVLGRLAIENDPSSPTRWTG